MSKQQLSLWGIICAFIFLPIFILWNALGGTLHNVFLIVLIAAWVGGIIIGIFIIVDAINNNKSSDAKGLLWLIGGIMLIAFPFIGGILLLIEKLMK